MRREHSKEEDKLIKFLQEHNCIFYSPLSYGDTSDWISGNAMIPFSQNSAVWNSTINMWEFQHTTQPTGLRGQFVTWNLKEPFSQPAMNFTSVSELYVYQNASDGYRNYTINFATTAELNHYALSMYGNIGNVTNSCQLFLTENGITSQKQYVNGVLKFNYNHNQMLTKDDGVSVSIGWDNRTNQYDRTGPFGMRNFAIFSSTLSLAEINEYFNIVTA